MKVFVGTKMKPEELLLAFMLGGVVSVFFEVDNVPLADISLNLGPTGSSEEEALKIRRDVGGESIYVDFSARWCLSSEVIKGSVSLLLEQKGENPNAGFSFLKPEDGVIWMELD